MAGNPIDQRHQAPAALRVPRALDLPDPHRRFSAEAMNRPVGVLFVVSQPMSSPSIAVHADLMRLLNPDRVNVHVLYNRRAAGEPYRSAGTSALQALPQRPNIQLVPAEFGPMGGARPHELLASSARAALPATRDGARLIRYIQRHRIDVIHCEQGSRNGFYGLALSRVTRARCIVHFHSQYGSWMTRPSRLAVHRAAAIIAVSSWTGRGIRDGGVPPQRIFPVLNGIELSRWDPARVDGARIRHEFGLQAQDPLVVMVAQLVDWKRQRTLIEAFRVVADRYSDARLLLVGNEGGGTTYTTECQRLVADLGLTSRVCFTGFRRDVDEILAAADIFALPSVGEPFGLAFVEAMAMGKPVVSVATGGIPEVVEHGVTGLLARADDVGQLAADLVALIDDPPRRRRMGEEGRRRTQEHFTAARMADEVEAVYRTVCGLPSVPAAAA